MSKLKVNSIEPKTGTNIDIGSSQLTSSTAGAIRAPGMVVAVHYIKNSTRTDVSGTGVREYTWGTFTKQRTDTALVYTGTLHFHDSSSNDSDATGMYIGFQSTSLTQIKKRHLCRIDVTGTNFKERPMPVTGAVAASEVPYAETYTVKFGTSTSSSYIANYWNPNTTDDSRYDASRESVLVIWEVLE